MVGTSLVAVCETLFFPSPIPPTLTEQFVILTQLLQLS